MKKNKRFTHIISGLHQYRSGFTLLELIVVVALIGVLSMLGASSYINSQKRGRDAKRTNDMKNIQNAFESYYGDNNGAYPDGDSEICIDAIDDYFPQGFPSDPKSTSSYTITCTGTTYCSCGLLESSAGNSSTQNCAFGSGSYQCVTNLQ